MAFGLRFARGMALLRWVLLVHEFSIATRLVQLVEEHAKRAGAKRVVLVKVLAGRLTGVVPQLLREAFEFCSGGTLAEGAELVIEETPLRCRCRACGAEYEPEGISLRCPKCKAANFEILSGRELLLEKVEVEV
ncbi:MAG TPA: hydrogenase maturation nickel metallochaperone HypA [Armatimonadetes bacterium]|nr:hydrogenase maturation nickel metallochaperone HypA [Armatimonadota bacterium]